MNFKIKMVGKQCGIPKCAHSLSVSCPYIQYWPKEGSLEKKHAANCVLIIQGVPGGM